MEFPEAVSALRTHLIVLDEEHRLLPYNQWFLETDICVQQPCMQLLATGGAGTLYDPKLFSRDLMDEELIQETCLLADDLWLKTMELLDGVPVVLARKNRTLKYLPGSQETALYHMNVDENQNDVQLAAINELLDERYGKDTFTKKILSFAGPNYLDIRSIMDAIHLERLTQRQRQRELSERLKKAYEDKSEINARLQKAYADKSEINAKLKKAYAEKSEINAKLKKTYAEKSEINAKLQKTYKEKAERGAKIKELQKQLNANQGFFGIFRKKK